MADEQLRFPLFVDLRQKKAVVVGGGPVALRRAAVLHDFGARVTVIAPAMGETPAGAERLLRPYAPGDLAGAFMAIAATDDSDVNAAVGREARGLGIWFNRSDSQEDCDFFFPAVCRGDGLVAGLVGDGGDHRRTARAAARVRKVLEEME